jgi:hypothetical protein
MGAFLYVLRSASILVVDFKKASIVTNEKFHGAANWAARQKFCNADLTSAMSASSFSESEMTKPSSLPAFKDFSPVATLPTFEIKKKLQCYVCGPWAVQGVPSPCRYAACVP